MDEVTLYNLHGKADMANFEVHELNKKVRYLNAVVFKIVTALSKPPYNLDLIPEEDKL